jgi:hypothetical protein
MEAAKGWRLKGSGRGDLSRRSKLEAVTEAVLVPVATPTPTALMIFSRLFSCCNCWRSRSTCSMSVMPRRVTINWSKRVRPGLR